MFHRKIYAAPPNKNEENPSIHGRGGSQKATFLNLLCHFSLTGEINMRTELKDKVEKAIELIIKASEEFHDLPWELGFSGGKDSTTVLSLTLKAIERGAKIQTLYVVYADTLLEHPVLRREALDALESLKSFPNVKPVRLTPEEDFIMMMVERGYPAPSHRFRWCMERLKLRPMRKFMQQLGKYVQLSGVRMTESSERAKQTAYNGKHEKIVRIGNPIVMPILDWSTQDVFEYLREEKRWDGRSFDYLLNLYEVKEESGTSCGCALTTDVRFGCWVCTVVKNDKMPISETLKEARKRILEISKDLRFREIKNGVPRSLNKEGRKEIAKVFLWALEREPEAFGYNVKELKEKLEKVLKE